MLASICTYICPVEWTLILRLISLFYFHIPVQRAYDSNCISTKTNESTQLKVQQQEHSHHYVKEYNEHIVNDTVPWE